MDASRRVLIAMHGMANSGFVIDPDTIRPHRVEFAIRPFSPSTMDLSIEHLRLLSTTPCRIEDSPRAKGKSEWRLLASKSIGDQHKPLRRAVLRLFKPAQEAAIATVKSFPERVIKPTEARTFPIGYGRSWYEVSITPESAPWALIEHLSPRDAFELCHFIERNNYRQAAITLKRRNRAKNRVTGAKLSNVLLRSTDSQHADMTNALWDAYSQRKSQPEVIHAVPQP